MNLMTTQALVENVLIEHPDTRDDDRGLIYYTMKAAGEQIGIDIDRFNLAQLLANPMLPEFETIRRTRQKLQHDNEELRGTRRMQRIKNEEVFIRYAKTKN